VDIHESARRHGVSDEDARHAVEYAAAMVDFDTESDHPKVFVVGPDRAGNMLEVIVLLLAEDRELAIHAMPLRKKYYRLLEGTSDD
jgi:hypothetical protein